METETTEGIVVSKSVVQRLQAIPGHYAEELAEHLNLYAQVYPEKCNAWLSNTLREDLGYRSIANMILCPTCPERETIFRFWKLARRELPSVEDLKRQLSKQQPASFYMPEETELQDDVVLDLIPVDSPSPRQQRRWQIGLLPLLSRRNALAQPSSRK